MRRRVRVRLWVMVEGNESVGKAFSGNSLPRSSITANRVGLGMGQNHSPKFGAAVREAESNSKSKRHSETISGKDVAQQTIMVLG
jgi:hypothetical protein